MIEVVVKSLCGEGNIVVVTVVILVLCMLRPINTSVGFWVVVTQDMTDN